MRNDITDSLSKTFTRLFNVIGCSAKDFPDTVFGSFDVSIEGDDYVSFHLIYNEGVIQVYHWTSRPREWFVKF